MALDKDHFVSVKDQAELLSLDRSDTRKHEKKLGYEFHRRRTPASRSQLILCVSIGKGDEKLAKRAGDMYLERRKFTWYAVLRCH